MKTKLLVFRLFLIIQFFWANTLLSQPPNPNDLPTTPVPINEYEFILLSAGIILGCYIVFKKLKATKKRATY